MKFLRIVCLLVGTFCFVYPHHAGASPVPCKYLHAVDAYNAADVVVTGKAVGKMDNGFDLRFQVTRVIKGKADSQIMLEGQRPVNTEWNGFSFKENTEVFLLLHKVQDGLYGAVETYNGGCSALLYYVVDGKVVLEEGKPGTPLDTIQDYFSQVTRKGE